MPFAIQSPTISLVMPWNLAKAFKRSDRNIVYSSEYADGSIQADLKSWIDSRKYWQLDLRLANQLHLFSVANSPTGVFAQFYASVNGPFKAFYFYDVFETVPKYSYDITGVSIFGRYAVHFKNPFVVSSDILMSNVSIELEQVATTS